MDLLSLFQTVGAFFGIVTGIVGSYVFLTRGHPSATVIASKLGGFGRRAAYLRVINPSNRPILLALSGQREGHFTLWPDHETISAVYGVIESETLLAVDPGETKLLPMIQPSGYDDLPLDALIKFHLSWRYAERALIRLNLPLRGEILKRDLEALSSGTHREALQDI